MICGMKFVGYAVKLGRGVTESNCVYDKDGKYNFSPIA